MPAPPEDLLDRFEINPAAAALPSGARSELAIAATPLLVEFDGAARLDPGRATPEPARPPAPVRQRGFPLGLLASLVVHLSPLLLLLSWSSAPAEIAPPIPVQLVIEEPPPPPPSVPVPVPAAKPPPPGRLASKDTGATAPEPHPPVAQAEEVAAEQVAEMRMAAVVPPPKPIPPPELVSALPAPVPPPEPLATPQELKPPPPVNRPAKQAVAARAPAKPRRTARIPGPEATRDEYLAYCETLIRRYDNMLPASLLAGRSGVTTIGILVLGDGTIARISILQSSGYRDIDLRAEQMVAAVGRFPPLPQWYQRPSMPLAYTLPFRAGALAR